MPNKPRMGRPPVDPSQLKRNRSFRVSDATYSDWIARAAALAVSMSEVIEIAVERELKRLERKAK